MKILIIFVRELKHSFGFFQIIFFGKTFFNKFIMRINKPIKYTKHYKHAYYHAIKSTNIIIVGFFSLQKMMCLVTNS